MAALRCANSLVVFVSANATYSSLGPGSHVRQFEG